MATATMDLAWDGQTYPTTPMTAGEQARLAGLAPKMADVLNALHGLARPRAGCIDRRDIQAIYDAMAPAYDLLVALEERRRWKAAGDAAAGRLAAVDADFPEPVLED